MRSYNITFQNGTIDFIPILNSLTLELAKILPKKFTYFK